MGVVLPFYHGEERERERSSSAQTHASRRCNLLGRKGVKSLSFLHFNWWIRFETKTWPLYNDQSRGWHTFGCVGLTYSDLTDRKVVTQEPLVKEGPKERRICDVCFFFSLLQIFVYLKEISTLHGGCFNSPFWWWVCSVANTGKPIVPTEIPDHSKPCPLKVWSKTML